MTGLSALESIPAWGGLAILVIGAMVAGVINTMAGGGSMLVLPLLVAVGLPPSVANGTLRVGVLVQSVAAVATFHRRGERLSSVVAKLAGPVVGGAAVGTWGATHLDDAWLQPVIGVLFAIWAVVLIVRPGGFTTPRSEPRPPTLGLYVVAFFVGIYGGFLQVAVGFPLLAMLTMGLGYTAVRANAIKVALTGLYTLVALPMFAMAGQVAWAEGIALAAGSLLGGFIGTRWQLRSGTSVVRWFVIVMAAASGGAMLWRSLA